jgi:predicted TIM-barrel fold metal-dependent hydrolase
MFYHSTTPGATRTEFRNEASVPVFDCHHHVGDVRHAVGSVSADELETVVADDGVGRLALMDEGGVDMALVMPGHSYEQPDGVAATRRQNDRVAAYRDARPDRFPVAAGVVEPLHGSVSLDELERCATDLGLVGMTFHARFQGVSIDHPWILKLLERMVELKLVPLVHAVQETPDEALWKIAAIARELPDVPMLILDAFSTFEGTRQALMVARDHPSLLFDTALCASFTFIEGFIREVGSHRVIVGSDLYTPSSALIRRIDIVEQVRRSSLSDSAKEDVLWANASQLFSLA